MQLYTTVSDNNFQGPVGLDGAPGMEGPSGPKGQKGESGSVGEGYQFLSREEVTARFDNNDCFCDMVCKQPT